MATVADLIVRELRDAGVHMLFGVPGGGSNLDVIAAAGTAGLPFVLTSTENGAAIAALAQGEITRRPGACLTTLGPGAASVVNGVACAFLDRAPLVVFTDSHPAAAQGAFEHQRINHAALLSPITKLSATLTSEHARDTLACALRTASSGRPGPVHLDCPGAVASTASLECETGGHAGTGRDERSPARDDARFERLLTQSRKPLVIVGLGARRCEDAAAIRALCDRRHVPAMVTYKAKGIVPDDHEWFGGVFTHGTIERPLIDESDLLIGVGLDPVELLPRRWTQEQPIVYCGPWPVEDRHVPFVDQIVSDVVTGAQRIETLLSTSDWDMAGVRRHADEQRQRICVTCDGLSAQRVVQVAAGRLAGVAGRVTVDAGAHMFPATTLWPINVPNGMLISNGLSTMGFALPAAIGAALADRARPVVALTGDAGLLMCVGELVTAVRERLRIIVIVFSDASLSLIEIKQQARQLSPAGVALGAIDWPRLAESVGMAGLAAGSEVELERAVEQAIGSGAACLIEATIDRSNYGAMLRAVRG
jgi:acetolactate synthase-1/2/3 large subunit